VTFDVLVIPNAFPIEFAERVYSFLDVGMPADWWYCAALAFEKKRDFHENWEENARRKMSEEGTAAGGGFGYYFHRTFEHEVTCDCPVCETRKLLSTAELIRRVSGATGISLSTIGHNFASYYAPGDFLSTHTDKDNGKVAFVWNLTKNWRPQWGGTLSLLNTDWRFVEKTVTPEFNSLVLFDVRGEGRPHFVSPVFPGVKEKRLAYSGWFA
jgi:SM-20-related protein